MKIFALDISNKENLKLYHNRCDENFEYRPIWIDIKNDPKNHYDALEFFKKYGRNPCEKHMYIEELEGEHPKTIVEHLINRVYFCSGYESYSRSFPEDMCEERTDWYDMKEFADNMGYFINNLISLIDE